MKNLRHTAILFAAAVSLGAPAGAQGFRILVNGHGIDTHGTPPSVINGSLLVPLAAISDSLGGYLEWRPDSRTVYGQSGDTTFTLPIDSTTARVNHEEKTLAAPATIVHGHTMVPLRFVATALGAEVRYDSDSRTVFVDGSGAGARDDQRPRGGRDRDGRGDGQPNGGSARITHMQPADGADVTGERPTIAADFADRGGSRIDPATVRLFVNGVNVTSDATVTAEGVTYRGHLDPGHTKVRVVARDHAGNRANADWTFDVSRR